MLLLWECRDGKKVSSPQEQRGSWLLWCVGVCFGEDGGLCEGGGLALLEKPLSPTTRAGTGTAGPWAGEKCRLRHGVHRAWRELHVPAEIMESWSVGRETPVMSPPRCNPKSAGTAESHYAPSKDHGDTLGTVFPSLPAQLS